MRRLLAFSFVAAGCAYDPLGPSILEEGDVILARPDAGRDASTPDADVEDAGVGDAGRSVDAGSLVDAGTPDAGAPIRTWTGLCPEGMAMLPADAFDMGWDAPGAPSDERPVHAVSLFAFCLDRNEVTVAQFERFRPAPATVFWAGIPQDEETAWSRFCNGGVPARANHPVNCVSAADAREYCASFGGRLPTEAEWEFAARGGDDRPYPWGSTPVPSADRVNACGPDCASALEGAGLGATAFAWSTDDPYPATAPAGSFPAGTGAWETTDQLGNVSEWVADAWAAYTENSLSNPLVTSGQGQVIRGGSWATNHVPALRTTARDFRATATREATLGFRCAATLP